MMRYADEYGFGEMTAAETEERGGVETIVLVGNPNVGKSVIFNYLTDRYVTVSNFPGTTVEVSRGDTTIEKRQYEVIDTPGVNSLIPMSEDERVTRDILLGEERPLVVVQVIDTKNLRRGLLITLQLKEMGLPFVVVLNMEDEAKSRGIEVDIDRLSELVGVPVISTVATQRKGLGKIRDAVPQVSMNPVPFLMIGYAGPIEQGLKTIGRLLPESRVSQRAVGLMALSGDDTVLPRLQSSMAHDDVVHLQRVVRELGQRVQEPVGIAINRRRWRWVDEIIEKVMDQIEPPREGFAGTLGYMTTHPVWGRLILAGVLVCLYEFVGVLGAGVCVDFLQEVVFEQWINPSVAKAVSWIPVPLVVNLLVGEYGVFTTALTYAVAIVMPIVGFFFLAFGVMEDSGYLPRLAVMSNRLLRGIGLNGKAILPLVLGLGCATMATMTTRILESKRDRIVVTFLLALGVPCSAQLGVVLAMLSRLSPLAVVVWLGVVAGVLAVAGRLASRYLPGGGSEFLLELPPLRVPSLRNIAMKTMARLRWYLVEAVPLFVLGTLVLFGLDLVGGMPMLNHIASPAVEKVLGLPAEASKAFLLGFLRRDYGAAGLFMLAKGSALDSVQVVVSMVAITLFVPCIANFFMMIKERGLLVAVLIVLAIIPIAFGVGGLLNAVLRAIGASF